MSLLNKIYTMQAMMFASLNEPQVYKEKSTKKPFSISSPKEKFKYNFIIPRGAKLYLFEQDGSFQSFKFFASSNEMPDYCVFYCIARCDENAIKKFKTFQNN